MCCSTFHDLDLILNQFVLVVEYNTSFCNLNAVKSLLCSQFFIFNVSLFVCFLQGLFFDEAYGFYPGQVLIGPAKVFSNVQWLSGVKPVLSRKCKFRVVVEEVRGR